MARKNRFTPLALTTAPDTIFHVGTRYGGAVIIGGQTGNVDNDERLWANENYPGSVHSDLPYWGFWAGEASRVTRTSAGLLRIDGMALATADASDDEGIGRIAPTTAAVLRWDVLFDDGASPRTWQAIVVNAATGATILTYSGTGTAPALPSLPAGSYMARVRVLSSVPVYDGLPADYVSVTGRASRHPIELAWTHPTLGPVYYDPIWNVGALPYDVTDDTQAALLDARATALAGGTARKHPSWADELYEFSADGTPRALGGEWSMLRFIAGTGDWIGDAAVHPNATAGPARWTASGTLTPTVAMYDPRMRSLGAFYREFIYDSDVLWEGALIAGRSGRTVALYANVGGSIEQTTLGTVTTSQRWCECAQSSEQVTSIARDPADGRLYLTTYCERFYLDETTNELVSEEPGGRSLAVTKGPDGKSLLGYATESDFANSAAHSRGFNYVLTREGDGAFNVGPGTAHHVGGCMVAHAGALYGIEETGDASGFFTGTVTPKAERRQYLARYTGGQWQRVTGADSRGWSVSERDAGPGVRARGGVMFFGEDAIGNPTAIRYGGTALELNISGNYHPRNPQTVVSADGKGENILAPARKRNANGTLANGWYLVETTGLAATITFTFNPTCGTEGCFCVPLSVFTDTGVDPAELPNCLQWNGECWRAGACSGTYLQKVVDTTAGTACYVIHGTMPYGTDEFPGIEWMDGRECIDRVLGSGGVPGNPPNPDAALPLMPTGTVVHCHRVQCASGGLISAVQIEGTADEQSIEAQYPFWVWLGSEPLPDRRGLSIDAATHTALQTFTARAKLGKTLWLELPREVVYVCFLIPPGKKIAPVSKAVF